MAEMLIVKQHVERLGIVNAQALEFFNSINQGVLDRDQEGKVLPGVVDSDELLLSWKVNTDEEFSLEPCSGEDEDFTDSDEENEFLEPGYEVGVWIHGSDSGGAQLSVYVVVEDYARAATWKRVRQIAKRTGWRLMVGKDDWGENELEAASVPLAADMDHCLIQEKVHQTIDQLYDAIQAIDAEE